VSGHELYKFLKLIILNILMVFNKQNNSGLV